MLAAEYRIVAPYPPFVQELAVLREAAAIVGGSSSVETFESEM